MFKSSCLLVKAVSYLLFLVFVQLFAVENFDRVEKVDYSRFSSENPYISIYIRVFDREGKFIKDLKRNDIKLAVNKEIRDDYSLRRDFSSAECLLMTVVIDVSGSMSGKPLRDEKKALKTFFQKMGIYDKLSLVTFNETPHLLIPFTRDKAKCIQKIYNITAKGNTALYDAVILSLGQASTSRGPRKAIIVISDGYDTKSKTKYETMLGEVKDKKIPIYVIGLGNSNKNVLKEIAKMSGGKYFFSPSSDDLFDIYFRIGENLKNTYVIEHLKLYDFGDNALYRIEITNLRTGKHIVHNFIPPDISFAASGKTKIFDSHEQNASRFSFGIQNMKQLLVGKNIFVTIALFFFVIVFIGAVWFFWQGKFLIQKFLITILSILLYFILQGIILAL